MHLKGIITQSLRSLSARNREIDRIKTASRNRIAALAAEGRGREGLYEGLKLLGIDGKNIEQGGTRPKIVDFELSTEGQLSPEELGKIAERMVNAPTKAEADALKDELTRGFYGKAPHA